MPKSVRFLLQFCLVILCTNASAGKLPLMPPAETESTVSRRKTKLGAEVGEGGDPMTALESLKMRKRFGLGITAGGGLAIMGLEGDINITPQLAASIGWGTGIDYSSFSIRARYYLLGEWVSPYVGFGFAHWWASANASRDVSPSILRNKFLSPSDDLSQGYNIFMAYPSVGVQFMHHSGFAVSFEVMMLFKLMTLANGTYAGASFHWYF